MLLRLLQNHLLQVLLLMMLLQFLVISDVSLIVLFELFQLLVLNFCRAFCLQLLIVQVLIFHSCDKVEVVFFASIPTTLVGTSLNTRAGIELRFLKPLWKHFFFFPLSHFIVVKGLQMAWQVLNTVLFVHNFIIVLDNVVIMRVRPRSLTVLAKTLQVAESLQNVIVLLPH